MLARSSFLVRTIASSSAIVAPIRRTAVAAASSSAASASISKIRSASALPSSISQHRFLTTSRINASSAPSTPASSSSASPDSIIDGATLFGSGFTHLHLRYSPAVQTLTVEMHRPDLHNAFNEHVIKEISALFRTIEVAVENDPDSTLGQLRAVVLTGAGASFSAGADLNWMKKMRTYTEEENLADSKQLFNMFLLLHRCPVPVIARVNGAALGGGVGLVAACDIAVSVASAKFGLTEVKLGLSPAVISSFVLPKMLPSGGNYYFLTGQRFDAAEAMRQGLVNQVVADEAELDRAVAGIIDELALNSPRAVHATKKLLNHVRNDPRIPESEHFCTKLIAKLRVSTEGQEGLASFFEKRKAKWIPAHLGNPKKKDAKK